IGEGKVALISLPEIGICGNAYMSYVGPCPPIKSGIGTVVTGKFAHQSDGTNVVSLMLEGQSRPTRVTSNHLYWSQDRWDYAEVRELRIGETVDSEFGPRRVVSVDPCKYYGL